VAPAQFVRTIPAPAPGSQSGRLDAGLEDRLAELQARLSGLRSATSNGSLSNGNGHLLPTGNGHPLSNGNGHITESPVKESHGAA